MFRPEMRILRLTDSDDITGPIPEEQRGFRVVERVIRERTGENAETILRPIWPSPKLPGLIDDWIERYEPDLVIFKINGYWYLYPSVPLQLRRKLGPLGAPIEALGKKAADIPFIVRSRAFFLTRQLLLATVGGATYFTTQQAVEMTEECARRILRYEHVGLVLRAPLIGWVELPSIPNAWRQRIAEEMRAGHVAFHEMAARLHAEYVGRDPADPLPHLEDIYQPDGLHLNPWVQEWYATVEAEALLAAWEKLKAPV